MISGYLVTISANNRSLLDFIAARALRILPALIAVTLFSVVIIGPLFTKLPLKAYLTNHETYEYLGTAYVFGLKYTLPGVFAGHPSNAVNGVLWTLPLEVAMYAMAAAIAFIGAKNRLFSLLVAVFFGTAFFTAVVHYGLGWNNRGPILFSDEQLYPLLRYAVFFFIGAAFSSWKDAIPLRWPIALCVAVVWIISTRVEPFSFIYFLAVPYLVFYVAFALPVVNLSKIGDLSYGLYLFAFPMQQSIIQMFGKRVNGWGMLAIVIPVTLGLAFLSSRFVERPVLSLKKDTARIGNNIQLVIRSRFKKLIRQVI